MINKLLIALGIVLAGCYAMHLAGPLHMVDDAPLYLAGASDIASGRPYNEARMPRGYPQALATLDFVGLNSNAGIVGLNLICMAIGLVLTCSVIRSEMQFSGSFCAGCALLCGFSWIWIRLVPVPMSEMVFFALSSAALAAISAAKRHAPAWAMVLIALAVALSVAAFSVRTIGAALFPAVAFGLFEIVVTRRIVGRRWAVASLVVGGTLLVSLATFFQSSLATRGHLGQWRDPTVGELAIARWRVGELGELFQNVSVGALAPQGDVLPISASVGEMLTVEMSAPHAFVTACPARLRKRQPPRATLIAESRIART
jgi:hypothetical protein